MKHRCWNEAWSKETEPSRRWWRPTPGKHGDGWSVVWLTWWHHEGYTWTRALVHPGDPIEVAAKERWRRWRWLTCVHHLNVWAAAPATPGRRRTGWRAASDHRRITATTATTTTKKAWHWWCRLRHSPTGRIWRRRLATSSKDRGHRLSVTTTTEAWFCRFGKRRAARSRWRRSGRTGRSDFLIRARALRACLRC